MVWPAKTDQPLNQSVGLFRCRGLFRAYICAPKIDDGDGRGRAHAPKLRRRSADQRAASGTARAASGPSCTYVYCNSSRSQSIATHYPLTPARTHACRAICGPSTATPKPKSRPAPALSAPPRGQTWRATLAAGAVCCRPAGARASVCSATRRPKYRTQFQPSTLPDRRRFNLRARVRVRAFIETLVMRKVGVGE